MLNRATPRPAPKMTRRQLLKAGAALAGAGMTYEGYIHAFQQVNAQVPNYGKLTDIEHIVFISQENRSFDHYFGSMNGVRGFSDPAARRGDGSSIFHQPDPTALTTMPPNVRYPFHLDATTRTGGSCLSDPDHGWITNHTNYDGGKMDGFMQSQVDAGNGSKGFVVMGYYEQADVPYYYALADSYTICDRYHASLIGQSDPNRIYAIAGSIDPEGKNGGPIVNTAGANRNALYGRLTYPTMAEKLQEAGITWKVYQDPDATPTVNLHTAFKNFGYSNPATASPPALYTNAFTYRITPNFYADCQAGTLPQVSWLLTTTLSSEHPPAPPSFGEYEVSSLINAILANPTLFAKTAIFITWDDPGGFFDHVTPPVSPPGTPGEFITTDAANRAFPSKADITDKNGNLVLDPIGLGFRVPMIIVSPFTRGGFVSSDLFDHTSMLRFIEARFGVTVPNLTDWRRATVGDMTSAFNFGAAPSTSVPAEVTSNTPSPLTPTQMAQAAACIASGGGTNFTTFPIMQMDAVQPGSGRLQPSGPVVPTIILLSREGSPLAGGDDIVINGLTFKPGASVTIGGINAPIRSISSDGTRIVATIPAHPTNGTVDVTVTNPSYPGTTRPNAFTYGPIAPQPIQPHFAPTGVPGSAPTATPLPQPLATRPAAPTAATKPLPQPPRH